MLVAGELVVTRPRQWVEVLGVTGDGERGHGGPTTKRLPLVREAMPPVINADTVTE